MISFLCPFLTGILQIGGILTPQSACQWPRTLVLFKARFYLRTTSALGFMRSLERSRKSKVRKMASAGGAGGMALAGVQSLPALALNHITILPLTDTQGTTHAVGSEGRKGRPDTSLSNTADTRP